MSQYYGKAFSMSHQTSACSLSICLSKVEIIYPTDDAYLLMGILGLIREWENLVFKTWSHAQGVEEESDGAFTSRKGGAEEGRGRCAMQISLFSLQSTSRK